MVEDERRKEKKEEKEEGKEREEEEWDAFADAGYLKLLRKSALIQIGKVWMNLGDYGQALESLENCFKKEGEDEEEEETEEGIHSGPDQPKTQM